MSVLHPLAKRSSASDICVTARTPASLPQLARISKSEDIWAPYPSVPGGVQPQCPSLQAVSMLISSPITYTGNIQDRLVDVSHFSLHRNFGIFHVQRHVCPLKGQSQPGTKPQDPMRKFKCAVILDFCQSFFTSYVAAQSAFFIPCVSRL
jgi:hypothetical protein